jgi:regulator of sirC expression with transglutaminase-like and TPR domain
MDKSEQILEELRRIRWLSTIIAVSLVIVVGSIAWVSTKMNRTASTGFYSRTFTNRASNLLSEGKAKEVLRLTEEREKNFPTDGYVYWFRGRAYYQLGQYDAALKAMIRAEELCPLWHDEYTGPFIKRIKENLRKKS